MSKEKVNVTPEIVHELTTRTKEYHPILSECIAEIVHAVHTPGKEKFHQMVSALAVGIMLLQKENDTLKTQVNNLASLIGDKL